MSKNFVVNFKNDFKFLEEYGFVFSVDPCNPNRPCYKNNHGEIIFWIQTNSGFGATTEIYYQINGWKYTIDIEEEYKKILKKFPLLKNKIKMFKELFEFLVLSSGSFYNLRIDKNISESLKNEEVSDLNIFKNNEALFNLRNRAITNTTGLCVVLILFFTSALCWIFFYEYSKSYLVMNICNITVLIFVMISEILIYLLLRKSLHIGASLSLIIYAFVPLALYFFFDRRFDYRVEIIFLGLMICSVVIHFVIYLIKKDSYYLLNGVIPLIYPLLISIVKTSILDEYLFLSEIKIGSYILIGLIIGIIAGSIALLVSRKNSSVKETFLLAFCVFCCFFIVSSFVPYLTVQNINYAFDNSIPIKHEYKVIDKRKSYGHGRYSSNMYYLVIYVEGEKEELKVNRRVYSNFEINETIDLYMYKGFLNASYYEYVEDN